MSVSYVQGGSNSSISSTDPSSLSVTLVVGAGDTLIASVGISNTTWGSLGGEPNDNPHVTDSNGNAWQPICMSPVATDGTGKSIRLITFAAYNCAGGSTIISTTNSMFWKVCFTVDEYAGAASVNAVSSAAFASTDFGASATSVNSGPVFPYQPEMLYSAAFDDQYTDLLTPSAGFTVREAQTVTSGTHSISMKSYDKAVVGGTYSNTVVSNLSPSSMHAVLIAIAPQLPASPLVQINYRSVGATFISDFPCSYTADNTAGNILIVAAALGNDDYTIADTQGNAWTLVYYHGVGDKPGLGFGYALNCKAGANIVTLTGGIGADESVVMIIAEYAPKLSSTYDASSANSAEGHSLGTGSTGTIEITSVPELIISCCTSRYLSTQVMTPSSGVVRLQASGAGQINVEPMTVTLVDQMVYTAGSFGETFTFTASTDYNLVTAGIFGMKLSSPAPLNPHIFMST